MWISCEDLQNMLPEIRRFKGREEATSSNELHSINVPYEMVTTKLMSFYKDWELGSVFIECQSQKQIYETIASMASGINTSTLTFSFEVPTFSSYSMDCDKSHNILFPITIIAPTHKP